MSKKTKKNIIDLYDFLSEHRHIIEREQERSIELLAKLPAEIKISQLEINNLYSGILYLLDCLQKEKPDFYMTGS